MSGAELRILQQAESRNGVKMSVHRYAEKRIITKGIRNPDGTTYTYVPEGKDIYQVQIELDNAAAKLEPGILQYMHGNLQSEVQKHEERGFLARAVTSMGTGESGHATLIKGVGTIWCEPSHKHFIVATMDNENDALLLDDKAFYACSSSLNLTVHKHANVSGVLSGNGLMQPKLSGNGVFVVESPVPVEEIEVIECKRGEEVVVDGDFMLMYSASLHVEIGALVKGLRNMMRSGEGFVYKFRGEGQIWVMPTAKIS
jgi:uncharacterized protein (AIM24 family)